MKFSRTPLTAIALGVTLVLGAGSPIARADDAAKPKSNTRNTVKVPDGMEVDIATPDGWSYDKFQPAPDVPPTITIYSPAKEACLKLTLLFDKGGDYSTNDKIGKLVENTAKKEGDLETSVEKKVTLKDLGPSAGKGMYAEFTQAALVGKTTKPGEYKVVCRGVLALGNTVAYFTVVGNSFDDKSYVAAKNILKSGVKPHK